MVMRMLSEDVKILEVILFVENKPLSLETLRKMSRLKEDRILAALSAIKEEYDKDYHGICLENSDEGYVLSPKKSMHESLRKTYGRKVDSRLTRAAVETLCLVAYKYGITRREIDDIRGVSSENVIKLLKERGLIKIVGRKKDEIGNPIMYGTTEKFLYEFNLSSIADLPQLSGVESDKYEEKDEQGNVLSGYVIKKRMKEEFLAAANAKRASRQKAADDIQSGKSEEVIIFKDDLDNPPEMKSEPEKDEPKKVETEEAESKNVEPEMVESESTDDEVDDIQAESIEPDSSEMNSSDTKKSDDDDSGMLF